jgi:hypothetical protein
MFTRLASTVPHRGAGSRYLASAPNVNLRSGSRSSRPRAGAEALRIERCLKRSRWAASRSPLNGGVERLHRQREHGVGASELPRPLQQIRLIQHLDSSAHGFGPEVALNRLFLYPLITASPSNRTGAHGDQGVRGTRAVRQASVRARREERMEDVQVQQEEVRRQLLQRDHPVRVSRRVCSPCRLAAAALPSALPRTVAGASATTLGGSLAPPYKLL